ncbi:MAG: prolyl oligopeptidase family serine peptidase [Alistipes ihumii]
MAWEDVLVQQGYIVACVDGRGTGCRGSEFKKCTYKQLGKYEVEDQIACRTLFGIVALY